MSHPLKHLCFLLLTCILLSGELAAQKLSISSDASRSIPEGTAGVYQFTVESPGGEPEVEQPQIPEVDGLEFEFLRVSPRNNTVIINGRMIKNDVALTYVYRVIGKKKGVYTVPSFPVTANGETLTVPPVRIEVGDAPETVVWTELELPRENIYVGEAVPATVRMLLDPKVVNIRPLRDQLFVVKEGDAFTIGNFGNQKERMIERGDRQLRELTWQVVITPLKTGEQPMVLQSDWVVTTQGERQQRRLRPGMFGSLFNDGYDTQQVALYTQDEEFNILPLPRENQPIDFTGGIGAFSVDQPRLSSTNTMAGEPMTMTLTVRGQGNFSRLQAPALEDVDAWRSYPPEEQFRPTDQLGYRGEKTFEYTLIPRESGELTTPEIHFNFFDPEKAKYIEMPIPGQSIQVQVNPNAQRPKARNPVTARRGPELLPIATTPGSWVSSITPIVSNPIFIGAQVLPAFIIGLVFVRRRHELRLKNDPAYARRLRTEKLAHSELNAARQAAGRRDAIAFYAAAQRAVQAAAARGIEQAPESLTIADIESVARQRNLSEDCLQTAREFFEAGDAIRFGGLATTSVSFDQELEHLENTVNAFQGKP